MIPKRQMRHEENTDAWLMTYADMITLLLAFFIIFVATSEPKQEKFHAATEGMRDYFSGMSFDSPFDGAMREIQGIVASRNAERAISVEKTRRGLTIEISSLALFAPGSAEMLSNQVPLLEQVADVLNQGKLTATNLIVSGYTDESTQPGWELGAMRAARVASALALRGIEPKRLRVESLGDTQKLLPDRDGAGNLIPENQAVNSRVVIRAELP